MKRLFQIGQPPAAPTGLDWTNFYSTSIEIKWNLNNTGAVFGYWVVAGNSANSFNGCFAGEDAGLQSSVSRLKFEYGLFS